MDKTYSTEELYALVLQGNNKAMTYLYENYKTALEMLAVKPYIPEMYREDIVCRAFNRIFKNMHMYDPNKPLFTWMKRITFNESMDFLRTKSNRNCKLNNEISEREHNIKIDPETDLEFQNLLDTLKEEDKNLITALYVYGYHIIDLSRLTGLTEYEINKWKNKIIKKLRKNLK